MSARSGDRAPLDDPLWALVHATSVHSGRRFFRELTRTLAAALGLRIAAVSERIDGGRIRALSVWNCDDWDAEPEYLAAGSPCGVVIDSLRPQLIERGARDRFPDDELLERWRIEGYAGAPLIDAGGRAIGLLCVMDPEPIDDDPRIREILEVFASRAALELDRSRALVELECQRAFLRQVLDIDPSLIFAKDRDGRFTLVNQALADVYGTTIEELIGKTDADFNPKSEEVEFFRRMDLEVMDTLRERFIPEEPLTDACGALRWVQTIKRPIIDANGASNQVLGVATDITELKRTREQLLERQRRQHERVQAELDKVKQELVRKTRLAAIGQVAASIAHELRNPLGAISNSIFFLGRHYPGIDDKWRRHLDIIRQEVTASDRIVTNLLDMSRAADPVKESVELGGLVREVFDRLVGDQAVALHVDVEPDPFPVRADPAQLRLVLGNLILNALQSMPKGGHVWVTGRREAAGVVVTVRDAGVGIDATIREEVFEPLFTTKAKGTGLGLAICREIVERHKGSIRLLEVAGGAAFELRFPHDG
ncbi:MAG TPA: ATP-binding protein [Candidatus Polarisedimenticolaceae bacterium]|nr:ATP-binding protein [Candidatus Polarisedimenticolaceae bacterium]